MRQELEHIRDCAKNRIQAGDEPTWSWVRHVKLIEAIDDFLAGLPAEGTDQPLRPASPRADPSRFQRRRTAAH
jgi:hypothetical protein